MPFRSSVYRNFRVTRVRSIRDAGPFSVLCQLISTMESAVDTAPSVFASKTEFHREGKGEAKASTGRGTMTSIE
jgi:hypothetical protein